MAMFGIMRPNKGKIFMKKNLKTIIAASAAALAFGGIAVGTTFALFTSKAETNVTVQSGTVKVEQSSNIVSVFELNDVEVTASGGVYTNSIGGKTYIDSENSGLLHLEKWAPGDKVVFEVNNVNKSNVAIRSRLSVSHTHTSTKDLFDQLDFSYQAFDKDNNPIAVPQKWATYEAAQDTSVGYLLSKVVVTIEFVDADDGEIIYDESNGNNEYQNADCTIAFTQEAVQGNAHVEDYDVTVTFDLDNEHATEEAPASQTIKVGNLVTKPTDPSDIVIGPNAGYNFEGWVDKDGHAWDFANSVVTGDLTLYAYWIEYR